MKKLISVMLVVLMVCSVAFADQIITTANVYLRDVPRGNKIALIPQGTVLTVLEKKTQHTKVNFSGKTGYVFNDYVSAYRAPTTGDCDDAEYSYAIKQTNIYPSPDESSSSFGYLKAGEYVTVANHIDNNWLYIIGPVTGYVKKADIAPYGTVAYYSASNAIMGIVAGTRVGTITVGDIEVRDKDWNSIATLSKGEIVVIAQTNGDRVHITSPVDGYVARKYVAAGEIEIPTCVKAARTVNLRYTPSVFDDHNVIMQCPEGTVFDIDGFVNAEGWFAIVHTIIDKDGVEKCPDKTLYAYLDWLQY